MKRLLPFLLIFALLLAGCAPAEPEAPEETPPETVDPAPPPEGLSEVEIVLAPSLGRYADVLAGRAPEDSVDDNGLAFLRDAINVFSGHLISHPELARGTWTLSASFADELRFTGPDGTVLGWDRIQVYDPAKAAAPEFDQENLDLRWELWCRHCPCFNDAQSGWQNVRAAPAFLAALDAFTAYLKEHPDVFSDGHISIWKDAAWRIDQDDQGGCYLQFFWPNRVLGPSVSQLRLDPDGTITQEAPRLLMDLQDNLDHLDEPLEKQIARRFANAWRLPCVPRGDAAWDALEAEATEAFTAQLLEWMETRSVTGEDPAMLPYCLWILSRWASEGVSFEAIVFDYSYDYEFWGVYWLEYSPSDGVINIATGSWAL